MEAQAEYTVNISIYQTPQAWQWAEYDRRKLDLWLECETRDEYHRKLAGLIAELGL